MGTIYPDFADTQHAVEAATLGECGLLDQAERSLAQMGLPASSDEIRGTLDMFRMHTAARACFYCGDATKGAAVYDLLLPFADSNVMASPFTLGSVHLALGMAATAAGRVDEADHHFAAAVERHRSAGWRALVAETLWFHAMARAERAGADDDPILARAIDEVIEIGTAVGMYGRVRSALDLRVRLGRADGRVRASAPGVLRRDRLKALLAMRTRAVVAAWTRGRSDDELARRFGTRRPQRALFAGMARAFQPSLASGFEGDLSFELLRHDADADADPGADCWTVEIHGDKATVRQGTSRSAAAVMRASVPTFVRVAAGEMHGSVALVEGLVVVRGDVMLVARLGDMFGAVDPGQRVPRRGRVTSRGDSRRRTSR